MRFYGAKQRFDCEGMIEVEPLQNPNNPPPIPTDLAFSSVGVHVGVGHSFAHLDHFQVVWASQRTFLIPLTILRLEFVHGGGASKSGQTSPISTLERVFPPCLTDWLPAGASRPNYPLALPKGDWAPFAEGPNPAPLRPLALQRASWHPPHTSDPSSPPLPGGHKKFDPPENRN